MNDTAIPPIPNENILSGVSLLPPTLTGYPFLGTLAAWSGPNGAIFLASDQSSPPYSGEIINPNWITFEAPSIAMAVEWENLFLAYADVDGVVRLASTDDGWTNSLPVTDPNSTSSGPALLFADDRLYLAWRDNNNYLNLATVDRNNNVQIQPTGIVIFSRPTLAWAPGRLYVLSGGEINDSGDPTLRIFISTDQGQSFAPVNVTPLQTFGPPAMAIIGDKFHLVWADPSTGYLSYAATGRLDQFDVTYYGNGCHGGGPAILGLPEQITIGWCFGAPPEDPRAHHISLAQLPVERGKSAAYKDTFARLARVGAPNPCPDPLTIYDPATDKCVPRGGCWGGCVLQAYTLVFGFPVFNPIKYGLCVASCKKSGSAQASDTESAISA